MHPNTYTIRWRGKNEGPYSAEKIADMLKARQIGLTHQVNIDNEWVTVLEFQKKIEQREQDKVAREKAGAKAAAFTRA